jgi:hypothetical protein
MKQVARFVGATIVGAVFLTGCGQKQEATPTPAKPAVTESLPAPTPPPAPPPAAPEAPAAAAPAAPASVVDLIANAKTDVDQAMALAKDGKYTEALSLLQQKATEVQANPDAKKLIDDAIAQIQKMASDAAAKAATDKVGGMLGGVGK